MHQESRQAMEKMLNRRGYDTGLNVLDVGSYDVNGNFRSMVADRGWAYTGLDVSAGPNVDIVSPDPYAFPLPSGVYDIVMSGSTMEHVEAIWRWVPELCRVLKPGGMLAIHTHWQFPEHRYPVDCWRVMPDGMRYLFDYTGVLENYAIEITSQWDIAGVAYKRGDL